MNPDFRPALIRLHLDPDLPADRRSLYTGALAGLRGVDVADATHADAIVTAYLATAREASCPVLLDRPEEHSLTDLASLPASRLMPAHQWRFQPAVQAVHASHAAGQLGAPGLLRVHHWLRADGALQPAACALVDLAHWFFAGPPAATHFLAKANYLQAHFGFPGGGMAILDLATRRPGSADYFSMHLIGSEGAAYADDHHNAHLLLDPNGPRALLPGPDHLLAVRHMLREFLAGLVDGRPWSVGLPDTLNALTTLKEAADA